jgi:hypothetical protein
MENSIPILKSLLDDADFEKFESTLSYIVKNRDCFFISLRCIHRNDVVSSIEC